MMDGEKRNDALNLAIRTACSRRVGVVDSGFLCQALASFCTVEPLRAPSTATVRSVIELLQRERRGCVLITGERGELVGIFSERDAVLKVFGTAHDLDSTPISGFMTSDPVTQPPDGTVAFALNLMSDGGFRNIPIVTPDGMPIGLVTVKDIMDKLVAELTKDLLNFPEAGE